MRSWRRVCGRFFTVRQKDSQPTLVEEVLARLDEAQEDGYGGWEVTCPACGRDLIIRVRDDGWINFWCGGGPDGGCSWQKIFRSIVDSWLVAMLQEQGWGIEFEQMMSRELRRNDPPGPPYSYFGKDLFG
jgi:hypothetical protein